MAIKYSKPGSFERKNRLQRLKVNYNLPMRTKELLEKNIQGFIRSGS